jgi:hypothetical protein
MLKVGLSIVPSDLEPPELEMQAHETPAGNY